MKAAGRICNGVEFRLVVSLEGGRVGVSRVSAVGGHVLFRDVSELWKLMWPPSAVRAKTGC